MLLYFPKKITRPSKNKKGITQGRHSFFIKVLLVTYSDTLFTFFIALKL